MWMSKDLNLLEASLVTHLATGLGQLGRGSPLGLLMECQRVDSVHDSSSLTAWQPQVGWTLYTAVRAPRANVSTNKAMVAQPLLAQPWETWSITSTASCCLVTSPPRFKGKVTGPPLQGVVCAAVCATATQGHSVWPSGLHLTQKKTRALTKTTWSAQPSPATWASL